MTSTTQPPSSGTPGSLGRQVSRAMAWNTLTAPLKTAVELATNLIILNVLTLPQFGVLRLVTSAAATLGIWVDLGIDRALPRFIPELQQERGQAAVRRFMQIIFSGEGAAADADERGCFLLFSERFVAFLLDGVAQLPERIDAAAQLALTNEMLRLAPLMVGAVLALVILGSLYDGLMAYLVSYFRQRAWNLITIMGDIVQPHPDGSTGAGGLWHWRRAGGDCGNARAECAGSRLAGAQQPGQCPHARRQYSRSCSTRRAPANNTLWRRFAVYTGMSNVLNLSDLFFKLAVCRLPADQSGTGCHFQRRVGNLVRQTLALLYRPLVGIQVPLFTRVRGGDAPLPDAYAAVLRILALIMLPGGVGLVLLANELILVQYPQYVAATLVIAILTPALFFESFLSSAPDYFAGV
ncbi:MAG: hypothetical protein HC893_15010 [Chloroflexaceae bacterium]|nr:hypothetical protein [Chloroflexaceae bacterium]